MTCSARNQQQADRKRLERNIRRTVSQHALRQLRDMIAQVQREEKLQRQLGRPLSWLLAALLVGVIVLAASPWVARSITALLD